MSTTIDPAAAKALAERLRALRYRSPALQLCLEQNLTTILAALDAAAQPAKALDALRLAVKQCSCRGRGVYDTHCTLCGDSTYDHACNYREESCTRDWCVAARAVLSAAAQKENS